MIAEYFFLVRKKKSLNFLPNQVKNSWKFSGLQSRDFLECKYRGFTASCKLLVTLKNSKVRLDFARKHLKELACFSGQMKPRLTRQTGEAEKQLVIGGIPDRLSNRCLCRGHYTLCFMVKCLSLLNCSL